MHEFDDAVLKCFLKNQGQLFRGLDMEGAGEEEILEADEVFDVGDGRYLIVEG